MRRLLAIAAAITLPVLAAHAQTTPAQLRPGQVYEIRREVNSSSTSSDQTDASTTQDIDRIVERVIAVREAGVELEYDEPNDTPGDSRASDWKFPARVLRPPRGPLQLLNAPELERRVERWLRSAGMTREACGHWIFTWNAFRIDCDPQAVIRIVESFTDWPDELRDGALWQRQGSRAPVPLRQERPAPGREVFVARMEIDPEVVRRDRAHSDVVVGEIMRRSVMPETALRAHAAEQISGTITTTFEVDAARTLRRRTTVSQLEVRGADGRSEHRTVTETVERRLVRAEVPGA